MKIKRTLLIVMSLIVASAIPSWAADDVSTAPVSADLGRKLLTRIDEMQVQHDAIQDMIGEHGAYRGFASKPIKVALTVLDGATEGDDARFLAALKGAQKMADPTDISSNTLADLSRTKRENIDGIVRFLQEQGVDIDRIREEAEAEKLAVAAKAINTAPSQKEVFEGDFFARPELGQYLHIYLTLGNVAEFFAAQSSISREYGWGEIVGDQRFSALFAVWGKTYQQNMHYIWRNLIEGIANHFASGDTNESKIDPYLKQFGYRDTWKINGHLTTTHHKRTHDAFDYLLSRPGTRALDRMLRGLRLK